MTRRLEDLPSQVKDKFLEAMRNPEIDTQPVFEDFLIGEEGRLWIDVADGSEAKSIWLTVGEDGKIQSTYSFPNAVTLELVVGEKAYGVRSQASGAPEVVVYGLRADV